MTFSLSGACAAAREEKKPTKIRRTIQFFDYTTYVNREFCRFVVFNFTVYYAIGAEEVIRFGSAQRKSGIQRLDQFIDVVLRRVEHQAGADDVAVEAAFADQDALAFGFFEDLERRPAGAGSFVLRSLTSSMRLHQAHAADVADDRMLFLQLVELARASIRRRRRQFVLQVLFFDHLDDGQRGGHRDGVAAEGGEGEAGEFVSHFRRRDRHADRHAVAHSLGRGDDVRLDVPVLDAEPFVAGAAPGGLHFVGDEQAAVLSRDRDRRVRNIRAAAR